MARILYLLYGLGLIATVEVAEYKGWGFSTAAQARTTSPRTVRQNPGGYRPIYSGGGRYYRGK